MSLNEKSMYNNLLKNNISVAKYLEQQLSVCGRSQLEVSKDLGYANPNIITMIKKGSTKVPLNKVALLAKSINVDPAYLLRLVMSEYSPEAWEAIESILGNQELLTSQDYSIIRFLRESTGNSPIDMGVEENRITLATAIRSIADRDKAKANASVDYYNSLPPNSRNK